MPDREDSNEDRPAEPASDVEASEASSRESRGGWPLSARLSAENVAGDISVGWFESQSLKKVKRGRHARDNRNPVALI